MIDKNYLPARICIFASGTGTNAEKLIDHFRGHALARVTLIACNRSGAGVIRIAEKENIPVLWIEKEKFYRGNAYLDELREAKIEWIVLAGFLWKIPKTLILAFKQRIINLHPALLPDFGGKGMYGIHVHEAVLAAGKKETGISIHYVNEEFDEGKLIYQARCPIDQKDTAESLARKVQALEHEKYPLVIEKLIRSQHQAHPEGRKSG
jgi:formyltetrahydrofolate-dependent phosphoribosylglycinamide formyltransferase